MTTFSMNAAKSFASMLKTTLFSILAIFIFNSCKKEILTTEIPVSRPEVVGRVSIKTIDYRQFLSSIQLKGTGKLEEVLNSTPNGSRQIHTSSSDILSGLTIGADSVKRLAVGDTVSYILTLSNKGSKSAMFHNLTVQQINGVTKAFITTYKPSREWVEYRKKGIITPFKGIIENKFVSPKGMSISSDENARQLNSSFCITFVIYEEIMVSCTGTGDNLHWPGEKCQNDGGPGAPYWDVIVTLDIECGGGGGNGGSGEGGGASYPPNNTTPTPPENYEPCSAFSDSGEEFLIPCGSEGGSSSDIPDYNYDPTYQYIPTNSETIYNSETGLTHSFGEITDFYNSNPQIYEAVLADDLLPNALFTQLALKYGGEKALMIIDEAKILSIRYDLPTWLIMPIATANALRGEVHFALDIVGLVPVYGEAADILNGAIYFVEGNYIDAAFSASAAVPVYGWVSTGSKWLRKAAPQLTKPVSAAAGKVAYVAVKNSKGAVRFIKVAVSTFSHSALAALKAVKPADNTLTNLSRTTIDQLSLRVKPIAQSLKNKIDDIVQNGDAAGTKTEALCDDIFATNGFVKHEAKIGSNNGFDGVYIKKDASGNVQEIIINEAKQVESAGNIKLNPRNDNTGLQAQMSDAWISNVISQLKNNTNTSTLGNMLQPLFQNNRSLFTKTVTGVDKASGDIVVLKLSQY